MESAHNGPAGSVIYHSNFPIWEIDRCLPHKASLSSEVHVHVQAWAVQISFTILRTCRRRSTRKDIRCEGRTRMSTRTVIDTIRQAWIYIHPHITRFYFVKTNTIKEKEKADIHLLAIGDHWRKVILHFYIFLPTLNTAFCILVSSCSFLHRHITVIKPLRCSKPPNTKFLVVARTPIKAPTFKLHPSRKSYTWIYHKTAKISKSS